MHQLQPTPIPYTKTLYLLEQTLITIVSYLSQGNFHTLSQEWIVSEQVNKTEERNALVAFTQDEADDPVSAMKDLARIMQTKENHPRAGTDSQLQYNERTERFL